jgi:UDPglucose 6-dehydrogenase
MHKPAFVFDGRNILPRAELEGLGFDVFAIGKPKEF